MGARRGSVRRLGFPIHEEGASVAAPGLYFVGVTFLRKAEVVDLPGRRRRRGDRRRDHRAARPSLNASAPRVEPPATREGDSDGTSLRSRRSRGFRRRRSRGCPKLPFELGIGTYDEPPPDRIEEGDLERLHHRRGSSTEANHLKAWVEVENGEIVDHAHGRRPRGLDYVPARAEASDPGARLRPQSYEPQHDAVRIRPDRGRARRVPAPRRVGGRPFADQLRDRVDDARALVIARTPRTTGRRRGTFPRHWIYDKDELVESAPSTSRSGTARRTATRPRGARKSPRRS